MNFKVSIIIPTYRRSEFLQRAVNSVLDQSYKNIEIVIVDDNGEGTADQVETQRSIKALFGDEGRIKYIKNPKNSGAAVSRNNGVKVSSGDYICFLDDDDIYLPDKIEGQLKFMVDNDLELSFSDIKMYNDNNKQVDARINSIYVKNTDKESLLKAHLLHHLTPTDVYMFSRAGYDKTSGFKPDTVIGEEYILMLESIEIGLKIGYYNRITAIQYIHNRERISQSVDKMKGDEEMMSIKEQYFDRLTKREIRYIKFRRYAVLVFYFKRNHNYPKAFAALIKSFFTSPVDFIVEMFHMVGKLRKNS